MWNKLVRAAGASAEHDQRRPRAAFKRFQNEPIRATSSLTEAGEDSNHENDYGKKRAHAAAPWAERYQKNSVPSDCESPVV